MRIKSLTEPTTVGLQKGDHWLSPDGHSPPWARVWGGAEWRNYEEEDVEGLFEIDEQPETEDPTDEQGMQTAVSDRDGREQGSGGKSEPEPEQRGKRGKVQSRRKGK